MFKMTSCSVFYFIIPLLIRSILRPPLIVPRRSRTANLGNIEESPNSSPRTSNPINPAFPLIRPASGHLKSFGNFSDCFIDSINFRYLLNTYRLFSGGFDDFLRPLIIFLGRFGCGRFGEGDLICLDIIICLKITSSTPSSLEYISFVQVSKTAYNGENSKLNG